MLQKYPSVKWVNNDYALRWWKLLIPVIFWWGRTSDSGNCILKEVKQNWSPTTLIRASLDQRCINRDYVPTFPVYQDYLTSKHSQLTYCRSNASQPDRTTPVLELTLVEYAFGIKTCKSIIRKGTIQFEGSNCFFSTSCFNDVNHN